MSSRKKCKKERVKKSIWVIHMVKLLKKGKGLGRIPMSGLRSIEKSGKVYQKATGKSSKELKEIQREIQKRRRK